MTSDLPLNEREELADLLFPNRKNLLTVEQLEVKYPPRILPAGALVTRVAPSPTGFMHIGSIYTGLINQRLAAQSGGKFLLRIEDTDLKRIIEGAVETIINGMKKFLITPDEGSILNEKGEVVERGDYGPYTQSQRAELYQSCVLHLLLKGLAYPCFITTEELDKIRDQQTSTKARPGIYGKWAKFRNLPLSEIKKKLEAKTPFVIRLKSPGSYHDTFTWCDQARGKITVPENDLDHVILKGDGLPTYHMAHLVDDHFMRVTDVIRGDEWISSVPLHLQLFSCMGWEAPRYTHIAPIQKTESIEKTNEESGQKEIVTSKRKLSKRHDPEANVNYFISTGYPVEGVIEYLLNLANSNFEDWRKENPKAPFTDFAVFINRLNNAGPLVDLAKLNDISKDVIANFSDQKMFDDCLEWLAENKKDLYQAVTKEPEYSKKAINIERSGVKPSKRFASWADSETQLKPFFDQFLPPIADLPFPENISIEDRKEILKTVEEKMLACNSGEEFFEKLKETATKFGFAANVKDFKKNPTAFKGHVGDVAMVLRVTLFGSTRTPDLFELISVMGKERVKNRINRLINL